MTDINLVVQALPPEIATWVLTLSPEQLAKILTGVYYFPQLSDKVKLNSAEIGKQGEDLFLSICKTLPAEFVLENTAKQAHAGDFVLNYNSKGISKRCLVDVKKYASTIPKKEIDKFFADMSSGNYDCGILLSLTSKIVGFAETISIIPYITTNGEVPIMFLNNLSDETLIKQSIQILFAKITNPLSNSSHLINVIDKINSTISNSHRARLMLREMEKSVNKYVQQCQELLITMEVQVKNAIDHTDLPSTDDKPAKVASYLRPFKLEDRSIVIKILALPWQSIDSKYELLFLNADYLCLTLIPRATHTAILCSTDHHDINIRLSNHFKTSKFVLREQMLTEKTFEIINDLFKTFVTQPTDD